MGLGANLLFQRMARGIVTGPPPEETIPMKRCIGKLDNGRRCAVVPLGEDEMCTSCRKRRAEVWVKSEPVKPFRAHNLDLGKKRGRPAKKGAVPDHVAELHDMAKPAQEEQKLSDVIIDAVDVADPAPLRRLTELAQAFRDEFDATVKHQGCSCHISPPCNFCLHPGNPVNLEACDEAWEPTTDAGTSTTLGYDSEKAELAGAPIPVEQVTAQATETDHVVGAGKETELQDCGCGMGAECMRATEVEISPAAFTPPQEQADPLLHSESALQRLLRPVQLPRPPLPPTAIVLDFDEYDFAAIQAEHVTPEEIKNLVLMLINGELGKIVEVEDPLAKSRHASG